MIGRNRGRGRPRFVLLALALGIAGEGGASRSQEAVEDVDDGSFGFSAPIACKEIKGYDDLVVLPDAVLTRDEKLLVYFKPRHYKTARVGEKFEVHFTQEGRIRRRGAKAVLWSKAKLLDETFTSDEPLGWIWLKNVVALKDLKPGDYDYDIVLRDEIGKSAPATRTLPFTIILPPAAPEPAPAK